MTNRREVSTICAGATTNYIMPIYKIRFICRVQDSVNFLFQIDSNFDSLRLREKKNGLSSSKSKLISGPLRFVYSSV